MVVSFENLPLHLQSKIAEKMNFWDFKEFNASSRCGKRIGALTASKVLLDVHTVYLKETVQMVFKNPISKQDIRKSVNERSGFPQNLLFTANRVTVFNDALLDDLLFIANSGKCLFTNVLLTWFSHQLSMPTSFVRMFADCNVKSFRLIGGISTDILRFPKYFELETLIHAGKIPDDLFLQSKAHTIKLNRLDSSPKVGPTLNIFFKQWYSNDRKITDFEFWRGCMSDPLEQVDPETLFSSIPFIVLWTKQTHDTSAISNIPLSQIEDKYQHQNIYLIQSESRKLIVSLIPGQIVACEATDENRKLLELMQPDKNVGK